MLELHTYLHHQIEDACRRLKYPDTAYQFDRPKLDAHGDISVNLAMMLARPLKQNPRQIAAALVAELSLDPERIDRIEIAGPGFINFFIAKAALQKTVERVLAAGETYGRSHTGSGQTALVEFVSANPTGPLTVGHGRQAVLGDTVANLLEWMGYNVTREYYFNNAGRQMRVLGDSVRLRYRQLTGEKIDFPEDHYQGEYILDIARKIEAQHGSSLLENLENDIFKDTAEQEIFADIKNTLAGLNIYFDSYFNESDLYRNGDVDAVVRILREKELAYDHDGAVWFKATAFGLDQDRVIIKSSGEPTYRLPDVAYHRGKFERNFERIIDIFGADHIATYPDVLAMVKALGYDTGRVTVLIHQFVTLFMGEERVKMSTRKANFVTLDELAADVGTDVTRWFFLMRNMQSHLNFDLQLAKTASDENPVYYNQYAHARICNIISRGEEMGIRYAGAAELNRLSHAGELEVIKKLMAFPQAVQRAAGELEPNLLTQYMSEVSTAFHKFYTDCRVVDEENPQLTQARLALCFAIRTVLRNGFRILGVSAPERM